MHTCRLSQAKSTKDVHTNKVHNNPHPPHPKKIQLYIAVKCRNMYRVKEKESKSTSNVWCICPSCVACWLCHCQSCMLYLGIPYLWNFPCLSPPSGDLIHPEASCNTEITSLFFSLFFFGGGGGGETIKVISNMEQLWNRLFATVLLLKPFSSYFPWLWASLPCLTCINFRSKCRRRKKKRKKPIINCWSITFRL